MAAQGEKLNRFDRESLNSFNRDTEWEDYLNLIKNPTRLSIHYYESAIYSLFDLTSGHPYFTKMLCSAVYECAVEAKDAEISRAEIESAASRIIGKLDTNAFAHYWRDGIRGDHDDIEIVSLKRCRVLLAWARASRSNKPLTHESIQNHVHSNSLHGTEVLPILEDFCRRGVFREIDGQYIPTVQLFAMWLKESGFSILVADQLGDELAEAKQRLEDAAYVKSEEILALSRKWDLYQGREISCDQIRVWIEQVEQNTEQRLLFKLLSNVRFIKDSEAKEKLAHSLSWLRTRLPIVVQTSRSHRRDDIIVTYADSDGKSGAHYATMFALANNIQSNNIVAPSKLLDTIQEKSNTAPLGVAMIDDMIGTGNNLIDRMKELEPIFQKTQIGTIIPFSIVAICATKSGESRIRAYLKSKGMSNADLVICELLEAKHFAFADSQGFWESAEEKSKAKALVENLGSKVAKRNPLGYENQGLLLTFSRNCPNNSLPILHSSGKQGSSWQAIFPRTKN